MMHSRLLFLRDFEPECSEHEQWVVDGVSNIATRSNCLVVNRSLYLSVKEQNRRGEQQERMEGVFMKQTVMTLMGTKTTARSLRVNRPRELSSALVNKNPFS